MDGLRIGSFTLVFKQFSFSRIDYLSVFFSLSISSLLISVPKCRFEVSIFITDLGASGIGISSNYFTGFAAVGGLFLSIFCFVDIFLTLTFFKVGIGLSFTIDLGLISFYFSGES